MAAAQNPSGSNQSNPPEPDQNNTSGPDISNSLGPDQIKPTVIIVMGVSGAGKSTVGTELAGELGWQFKDADNFHSEANKTKMHAGIALTDEDRRPWLQSMADSITNWLKTDEKTVLACSALKESYREVLRGDTPNAQKRVGIVHLHADFAVLAQRLEQRKNHFMNKDLLKSQLATLEEPDINDSPQAAQDPALIVDAALPPKEISAKVRSAFGL